MTLENDDKFVVSRSGDNYSVEQQNLMANLENTDLMLVSREGTNYKITGEELKESLGPTEEAPVISSITLEADSSNTNRFTNAAYNATLVMNPEGSPTSTKALKAEVRGQLSVVGESDEIVDIEQTSFTADISGTASYIKATANGVLLFQYDSPVTQEQFEELAATEMWSPLNPNPARSSTNTSELYLSGQQVTFNFEGSEPFTILGTSALGAGGNYSLNFSGTGFTPFIGNGSAARQATTVDEFVITPTASSGTVTVSGTSMIKYIPILGEGNTKITLASDANLTNGAFKAGDVVRQNNSPIVPTSSFITLVDSQDLPPADYVGDCVWSSNSTSEDAPAAFNGVTTSPGWYTQIGTQMSFTRTIPCYKFEMYVTQVDSFSNFKINGKTVTDLESSTWNDFTSYLTDGNFESFSATRSNGSPGVFGFRVNGRILIQDEVLNETTLTLASSDGLDDFEPGDVVQTSDILTTSNVTTGNTNEVFTEAWNSGTNNVFIDTETVGQYIEFSVPGAGSLLLKGGRTSTYDVNITATGDFDGGTRSWVWGLGSTSTQSFDFQGAGVVRLTVTNNTNGMYFIRPNCSWEGDLFKINVEYKITAIDESVPSLTTDGGTWLPGQVVTGPQTDITATLVSADPSVPSMTVSDVVGPWSANTGNYVVDTVVNPIMIKPETSPITEVGNSTGATALMYGMDRGISNLADVLANGTLLQGGDAMPAYLVVVHQGPAKAGETVWQTNGSGAVSIPDPAGGHFDADGNRLGGTGNYNETEWTTFLYQDTNKDTYTVSLVAAYTVFTLKTAGTIPAITQGVLTTLALTDDTDVNQFAAGDDVYANQSYTPESSEIVGVSVGEGLSWEGSQLNWTVSNSSTSATTPCYIPLALSKSGGHYWEVEITNIGQPTELGINYDTSPIGTYKDSICGIYFNSGGSNPEAIVLMKNSAGTSINTPGVSGHGQKLCLPNSTVGVKFPVGTVVMFYVDGPTGKYWIGKDGQWLGTTNGTDAPNINPDPTTGTDPIATLTLSDTWYFTSLYNCTYQFEIQRTNQFGGDTVDLSLTNNKDLNAFAVGDTVSSGSGPTGVISDITGLDMSLSQPTGTWEVGDTVIGPTLPPATGTVDSTENNTMTLSVSDGTWVPGTKVTMDEKEVVISTLYCQLDTIGNVTDLSSVDPGYTDQASNAPVQSVKFPGQLPTGNTPDIDLPPGTSINVSAKATNSIGTSSSKSNTLFPSE